ncbi:hypothetical protein CYMTET_55948, partial [Cymbomonas tetramitiformis]
MRNQVSERWNFFRFGSRFERNLKAWGFHENQFVEGGNAYPELAEVRPNISEVQEFDTRTVCRILDSSVLEPVKDAFEAYAGNNGSISELQALYILADFGLLEELPIDVVLDKIVEDKLQALGPEISLDDFGSIFTLTLRISKEQPLVPPQSTRTFPAQRLKEIFAHACGDPSNSDPHMDIECWLQLCHSAGLTTKKLTTAGLEVLFAKGRSVGMVTLDLEGFTVAVSQVAHEMGLTFEKCTVAIGNTCEPEGGAAFTPIVATKPPEGKEKEVFNKYESHGRIATDELPTLLQDLQLLTSHDLLQKKRLNSMIDQALIKVHLPSKRELTLEQYITVLNTMYSWRRKAVRSEGPATEQRTALTSSGPQRFVKDKELQSIFHDFAAFGMGNEVDQANVKSMDGSRFAKLCRECRLLDSHFTSISVDIIYAKTKQRNARKIDFKDFLQALALIAAEKDLAYEGLVNIMKERGKPKSNHVTSATEFKFATSERRTMVEKSLQPYDDNGLGVLGKEEVLFVMADLNLLDGVACNDAATLVDRTFLAVDVDGSGEVSIDEFAVFHEKILRVKQQQPGPAVMRTPGYAKDMEKLDTTYNSFATKGEMNGFQFAKLCREANLLDSILTPVALDIVFARSRPAGKRKMTFDSFTDAVAIMASEKGMEYDAVVEMIQKSIGSVSSQLSEFKAITRERLESIEEAFNVYDATSKGTINKDEVRFMLADLGMLEGVHSKTTADCMEQSFTEAMIDISRGFSLRDVAAVFDRVMLLKQSAQRGSAAPDVQVPSGYISDDAMKHVFNSYCVSNRNDHSSFIVTSKFVQLCRDAFLTDAKISVAAVEVIFARSKTKGNSHLSFPQFLYALALLAIEKDLAFEAVALEVAGCSDLATTQNKMANKVVRAFLGYDRSQNGCLDVEELAFVVADLGLMESKNAKDVADCLEKTMQTVDKDGTGTVSVDGFKVFYDKILAVKTQKIVLPFVEVIEDFLSNSELKMAFSSYATFGGLDDEQMDSMHFCKLCEVSQL